MNFVQQGPHREHQLGSLQKNGDDIRQVEGDSCQRKDRVRRNWTRKVQKSGKDPDKSGNPDSADRGTGIIIHHGKVATIWEAFVTAEGIHGPGTSLEGGLDDKESCEADESP
jgi:hypothetical protein